MNKIKAILEKLRSAIIDFIHRGESWRPKYAPVLEQFKTLWNRAFPRKKKKALVDEIINNYANDSFRPLLKDHPLIFKIENTNNHEVVDVEIFRAAQRYIFGTVHEINGIKISYYIPGFTYSEFLMHLLSYKYVIGMVRLSFVSVSQEVKVDDLSFTIEEREIWGATFTRPVTPIIDKEQYQNSIYDENIKYKLDCLSGLKFRSIPGHTTILLTLYPTDRSKL